MLGDTDSNKIKVLFLKVVNSVLELLCLKTRFTCQLAPLPHCHPGLQWQYTAVSIPICDRRPSREVQKGSWASWKKVDKIYCSPAWPGLILLCWKHRYMKRVLPSIAFIQCCVPEQPKFRPKGDNHGSLHRQQCIDYLWWLYSTNTTYSVKLET